jgi:amino acid transporter
MRDGADYRRVLPCITHFPFPADAAIDNAWVALGGSITVAVANGGAPGIIYEFLAACVYYGFVATSIAELASSIPSAGGGEYLYMFSCSRLLGF